MLKCSLSAPQNTSNIITDQWCLMYNTPSQIPLLSRNSHKYPHKMLWKALLFTSCFEKCFNETKR